MGDRSKINKQIIFTSDQTLYEISNIKKTTNDSILRAIKETSIDCSLHSKSNKKEGLICYSFGSPSVNHIHINLIILPKKKIKFKHKIKKLLVKNGQQILLKSVVLNILKRTDENNKTIGEIYDLDAYNSGSSHFNW